MALRISFKLSEPACSVSISSNSLTNRFVRHCQEDSLHKPSGPRCFSHASPHSSRRRRPAATASPVAFPVEYGKNSRRFSIRKIWSPLPRQAIELLSTKCPQLLLMIESHQVRGGRNPV